MCMNSFIMTLYNSQKNILIDKCNLDEFRKVYLVYRLGMNTNTALVLYGWSIQLFSGLLCTKYGKNLMI